MPNAPSPTREELTEEIAKAIELLIDAEHAQVTKGGRDAEAWCEAAKVCNQAREALTAAILSRLGEAEARREEAQGAPFGPGSCPDGPNPSVSGHSACDPSREPDVMLRSIHVRDGHLAAAYNSGASLAECGRRFGISKQRAHQILAARPDVTIRPAYNRYAGVL